MQKNIFIIKVTGKTFDKTHYIKYKKFAYSLIDSLTDQIFQAFKFSSKDSCEVIIRYLMNYSSFKFEILEFNEEQFYNLQEIAEIII